MFIILNSLGGHKVRINTDKIIKYSSTLSTLPLENSAGHVQITEMIIDQCPILCVKETSEEIDKILHLCYITVYERKNESRS